MARIEIGDIVQVGTGGDGYHAIVRGVRLRRLVVERCDGLPTVCNAPSSSSTDRRSGGMAQTSASQTQCSTGSPMTKSRSRAATVPAASGRPSERTSRSPSSRIPGGRPSGLATHAAR